MPGAAPELGYRDPAPAAAPGIWLTLADFLGSAGGGGEAARGATGGGGGRGRPAMGLLGAGAGCCLVRVPGREVAGLGSPLSCPLVRREERGGATGPQPGRTSGYPAQTCPVFICLVTWHLHFGRAVPFIPESAQRLKMYQNNEMLNKNISGKPFEDDTNVSDVYDTFHRKQHRNSRMDIIPLNIKYILFFK